MVISLIKLPSDFRMREKEQEAVIETLKMVLNANTAFRKRLI